jgi:hypothetical protein
MGRHDPHEPLTAEDRADLDVLLPRSSGIPTREPLHSVQSVACRTIVDTRIWGLCAVRWLETKRCECTVIRV